MEAVLTSTCKDAVGRPFWRWRVCSASGSKRHFWHLDLLVTGNATAPRWEPLVTRAFVEDQFLQYDADRPRKKSGGMERLAALRARLYGASIPAAFSMQCSAQIVNETDWILDRHRTSRGRTRICGCSDPQPSATPTETSPLEQLETDGSRGVCYDEWVQESWIRLIGALKTAIRKRKLNLQNTPIWPSSSRYQSLIC